MRDIVYRDEIIPALKSAGVPYNFATQRVIDGLPSASRTIERYHDSWWPEVITCQACGMTARPKHRDPLPPDKVFCPFCGEEVEFKTVKEGYVNA